MKFSYRWLKELVDFSADPQKLARDVTMVGLQLESLRPWEDDFVLDCEITVNRPDCLSMIGMAREISVLYGRPAPVFHGAPANAIRVEQSEAQYKSGKLSLTIILENPDLCPRYCGQIITGVKIGPSPEWIRKKLEACGLRSINNVVDITNLVMLETGQPLHAFDFEKLAGSTIRVRKVASESLVMIDDKERPLTDPMLIIADAERSVAVAGVMGGKESEVTNSTKTLMLESAYFNPASVRKTAKSLELSTDASYRFERGVDTAIQAIACQRAADLFKEYAGGELHPILDVFPGKFSSPEIVLRYDRVSRLLGEKIDPAFVDNTLVALGFHKKSPSVWEVPSFRVDVFREIDLVEEVARHYGYNQFPKTLPKTERKYQQDYATFDLERDLGMLLRGAGIDEAFTYSFVEAKEGDSGRTQIINPISDAMKDLRPSLLPNLLQSVEFNLRHRNEDVRLFEIGRVFLPEEEQVHLVIVLLAEERELKGVIEAILPALQFAKPEFSGPDILVAGHKIGELGIRVIEEHSVQTCELSVSELGEIPKVRPRYQAIVTYPFIERDVSFVLDETIRFQEMEQLLLTLNLVELRSWKLKYRYQGSGIPKGKVSITFQFIFQSPERTLTSEEADAAHSKIVAAFSSAFNATVR